MPSETVKLVSHPAIADAVSGTRHVFIRDLVLTCSVSVHKHEHEAPQRVRINLDLGVREGEWPTGDRLANVVCYDRITQGVRDIAAGGHVNLVETLAENIATMCLSHTLVRSVRVRVEKLDVYEDAASVGVEIERFKREA